MVLTDDNFASIEAAVEEAGVWDNLVKFITWTLPTNFRRGLVIVAAILAGATLPITPLQIPWINMTTAVLLGLPLAFEPIEKASCTARRAASTSRCSTRRLIRRIVPVSFLLLAGAFGLFLRELAQGHSPGRSPHGGSQRLRHGRSRLPLQLPPLTRASGSRAVFQPVDLGRGRQHDGAATGDDLPARDEPTVRHGPDRGGGMAGNHPVALFSRRSLRWRNG